MFPIGDDDSSRRTVPVVTYALIALNLLFFFAELNGGDAFIQQWSFVPRRFLANPGGDGIGHHLQRVAIATRSGEVSEAYGPRVMSP